jgi:hypothetical protein
MDIKEVVVRIVGGGFISSRTRSTAGFGNSGIENQNSPITVSSSAVVVNFTDISKHDHGKIFRIFFLCSDVVFPIYIYNSNYDRVTDK